MFISRMISEDWSNDPENAALISYILTDIHIETAIWNHNNISQFFFF